MTFEPGRAAHLEQKLAAKLGELLAFAGHHNKGALVDDTYAMARALQALPMNRKSLSVGVALLALTILHGPAGPIAIADVPGHPDNLPDRRNTETVDGYATRLVANLQRDAGGTFGESATARSFVYARAIGGIGAIIDSSAATEDTIAQIRKILAAVQKVEDQAGGEHP